MAVLQVPVPNGKPVLAWGARPAGVTSLLFVNQDLNNYVYLGHDPTITAAGNNVIPVAPNGTFSADPASTWWVIGSAAGIQPLVVVPGGQAFFLGVTQGMGQLAIPSVRSPNYSAGVTGWTINKDGSAEFNNLTVRGTFAGPNYVINPSGEFFYSGTPAAGNLVYSETLAASDPVGNKTIPGTTVYQGNIAVNTVASGMTVYSNSSGQSGTWTSLGAFFLTTPASTSYWYSTIGLVNATPNSAQEANTVPPPVVPAAWHSLTLTGGWTGTLQYKLEPNNRVSLRTIGSLAAGTLTNGTQIATIPAGWVPVNQQQCQVMISSVGTGSAASGNDPYLLIAPSTGAVTITNFAIPVATNIRVNDSYSLD